MTDKVLIGFESTPVFADNPRALYEYLQLHQADEYDMIWIARNSAQAAEYKQRGIECICPADADFDARFSQVMVIFSTHNSLLMRKKDYQIWITLWHGVGMKRSGYLNDFDIARMTEKNIADSSKIDYFVTTSEFMRVILAAVMGMNVTRFLEFGQPRNDCLFSSDGQQILSQVCGRDISAYQKVLLYLPTFRNHIGRHDGVTSVGHALGLEDYDEGDLDRWLREKGYLLVVKPHPSEDSPAEFQSTSNIVGLHETDLSRNDAYLNQMLNAVDLLITDYSSVQSDYLLLDRPILYIGTDEQAYRETRGIFFDDLDFWICGPSVADLQSFETESERLLVDPQYFASERARFNTVVNAGHVNACQRIAEFLHGTLPMDKNNLTRMAALAEANSHLQAELDSMRNSRAWKLAKLLGSPLRFLKR